MSFKLHTGRTCFCGARSCSILVQFAQYWRRVDQKISQRRRDRVRQVCEFHSQFSCWKGQISQVHSGERVPILGTSGVKPYQACVALPATGDGVQSVFCNHARRKSSQSVCYTNFRLLQASAQIHETNFFRGLFRIECVTHKFTYPVLLSLPTAAAQYRLRYSVWSMKMGSVPIFQRLCDGPCSATPFDRRGTDS